VGEIREPLEARVIQRDLVMVRQAKQVVVVEASLVCPIEKVHFLVTDSGASDEATAKFASQGIKVIKAQDRRIVRGSCFDPVAE
jgi:DeoR/GlpR family transcriptional regulator of sugar metabolism